MKKTLLTLAASAALLAATGAATPVLAQSSAITNAQLSLNSNQLDKAIESINQAVASDKTKDKDKPKAWFTRGNIYYQLVDPSFKTLTAKFSKDMQPGEALQKSAESYQKALELDGPTGEYGKQVPGQLKALYGLAFNEGVNSFNAKEYDKAIASYKLASQLNPQDTTAVLYSAYALEGKQDLAGAQAAYTQLLTLDAYKTKPASVQVYNRLLYLAQQQNDQAGAQRVLQQAITAYPTNKNFMIADLQQSMSGGGAGDVAAIDKITKTITADPTNANLYAVRGSLYDRQKPPKTELAQADYRKAIELDPNTFDAQYNLGIYNFNQAAALFTKASKMDLPTYQAKGKAVETEGKRYFESSLPYFEKALTIQPNDPGTLFALQKVYARLNRPADAKKMDDRLQALKK